MFQKILLLSLLGLFSVSDSFAGSKELPPCLDTDRSELNINNEEVIDWKSNTPNQYKDRALVLGRFVGVLLERRSHLHLEIDLTPNDGVADRADHLEIVYNKSFGDVDGIDHGATVAACGDYITARDQAGPYKPSPVDAILHWVHASNNPGKHVSGFLIINGREYGRGSGKRKGLVPWAGFFPSALMPAN